MSTDRSKLHHLVPAPRTNTITTSSSINSSSINSSSINSNSSSNASNAEAERVLPRRVRPKNASRACSECQKRKIKCIGANPCKNCHENSLYCEVNDETDGRRRFALKRKVEDLEQDRHLLLGLMEALREDDDYHAVQLFNLIRSNASLDEIRRAVGGRMERLSSSQSTSTSTSAPASASTSMPVSALLSTSLSTSAPPSSSRASPSPSPFVSTAYQHASDANSASRKMIMDIDRLTEIPLFELPARPWTEVTSDEAFVSHLVSLWLTWDHVSHNWIDKDLFIQAMKEGDVHSPFCSPFLVNTILAQACLYSSYPEAFIDPDNLASRGQHFYNEAKRHLDAMEGRVTLTTVQGLGILFIVTCLMGKDRVGRNYMSQTVNAIRGLLAHANEFIAQAEGMEQSIGLCVRGIFSVYTLASLALQVPFSMRPPKREYLPILHDPTDTWMPYPSRSPPVPAHRNCIHNQSFDLHLIVYDVVQFYCPAEPQDEQLRNSRSYEEVEKVVAAFYDRLTAWYRQLPECLQEGQSWTPAAVGLHMMYHVYIITISSLIKVHPSAPARASSTAQQRCISSALAVRDLINTHRSKWRRVEHLPVEYMQIMTVCLFTLLEALDSPSSRQGFVDISIVARAMARRYQLARGLLRLVQLTARQQGIALPEEVKSVFEDFEREWVRTGGAQPFSSLYPNFALSLRVIAASIGSGGAGATSSGSRSSKDLLSGSVELDLFLREWDDTLRID